MHPSRTAVRRFARGSRPRIILALNILLIGCLAVSVGPAAPRVHAAGNTLYVNGSTGNDGNDCFSAGTACQTIGAAIAKTGSGDTVSVAPGTYNENLTIINNITVVGSGRSSTIIDGGQRGTVVTVQAFATNVTIQGVTLRHGSGTPNSISAYQGGGLLNYSPNLTVIDSAITGNSVGSGQGYNGFGGGVYNAGSLTLSNVAVDQNSSNGIGAGIANINGGYILLINSEVNSNTLLNQCQLGGCQNLNYLAGSGIYNAGRMAISHSVINSNGGTRVWGGGIFNFAGRVSLSDSTVAGNYAYGCNACDPFGGPFAGFGGGIYNYQSAVLLLDRDAILNNIAPTGFGGGIANSGLMTATNTTITLNSAAGCSTGLCSPSLVGGGGGIYSLDGGQSWLLNDTVSNNQANIGQGGGVLNVGTSHTILLSSILAANTADTGGPDCFGTLASGGYNLLGDPTSCHGLTNGVRGDQTGATGSPLDPRLAGMGDNGGPTYTQALLPGSPAINAGRPGVCLGSAFTALITDQRGAPRPDVASGRCDIGAYEAQITGLALQPSSGTAYRSVTVNGAGFTPGETVQVTWPGLPAPLATATASPTGNISAQVTIPNSLAGPHTITALGQTSGVSLSAVYTVQPIVVLRVRSGPAGSANALLGFSFGANEVVQAHWLSPTGVVLGTTTTNKLGSFIGGAAPVISFTVPLSPTGAYPVYGVGLTSGTVVSTTFQVLP